MRQRVDQQRIELFLQRLGREFSKPGRIYLVGGTTMVYEGLRQQTLDIDLALEIADEDHSAFVAAVRRIKESLSLNIEEASPVDFIPLPAGYRERSQFVGRYGQLDVFHFDLYSTALSKIERGTENDFADVLSIRTMPSFLTPRTGSTCDFAGAIPTFSMNLHSSRKFRRPENSVIMQQANRSATRVRVTNYSVRYIL